ncbi:MAG: hypothetical protein F6K17_33215 [Okeania sp. SIO3C4]|nr:hypothetical protein [Okeania sp. SIO3B3]NER07097.1 hypothetical protein [Okeania sp. SIO3C4]
MPKTLIISCSFEYLHFGGRKAAMLRELFAQHSVGKAEGKERFKARSFFYN